MPHSTPPPLSRGRVGKPQKMTWLLELCKLVFRFGSGIFKQQIAEFAEEVPVDDGRLDYSVDAPFLLCYKSFQRGSGERGHPVYPAPARFDKHGNPIEAGYCCADKPMTVSMMMAYLQLNRSIRHINIGYEVLASEHSHWLRAKVGTWAAPPWHSPVRWQETQDRPRALGAHRCTAPVKRTDVLSYLHASETTRVGGCTRARRGARGVARRVHCGREGDAHLPAPHSRYARGI
jgi:hypothetical protein